MATRSKTSCSTKKVLKGMPEERVKLRSYVHDYDKFPGHTPRRRKPTFEPLKLRRICRDK